MENPYAPPTAQATELAPTTAVQTPQFTPNQVALATFLGTMFAGSLLIASNDRAMGQPARATQSLGLGFAAAALTLGLALILPENFPSFIIPLATTFAARAWSQARLAEYLRHAPTPPRRSNWHAAGIGLACLFGCAALFIGLAILMPEWFPE
jgi:hypothetical protein